MQLDFLEAADGTPLTKAFRRLPSGAYDVTPYPMLREFNSHRADVETIEDFHSAVLHHAKQNHCLVKGNLNKQLISASRQGTTTPSDLTTWMCLDLDFDEGWDSIDAFLADLDPALSDVSYVFQHSASSGIKSKHGIRGHVFMMLDAPIAPSTLKLWLRYSNLNVTGLVKHLSLTASGQALRWPLDITTCQNDKLLYIAPPMCDGFDDPIKDRFILVQKAKAKAPRLASMVEMSPGVIEASTHTAVATLRDGLGLPKIKPRIREGGKVEYLSNPDKAVVTDVRAARGYVYLNLNGGDSWGYYFPEENPEFLYNFKGEPTVKLKDIAPDFYWEWKEKTRQDNRSARDFVPIVFRDRMRDAYYNGKYYPERQMVDITKTSSLQRLQHFMAQFGEQVPEIIEDWEVEFNPTTFDSIDVDRKWVNSWQPTPYLIEAANSNSHTLPPTIHKVIRSICVDDQEVIDHFINWLAYIVQTRLKTGTAWIFHGVSGTGKGVFFNQVLRPLFGHLHALEYTIQQLEDQFNGPIEQSLILWIDEFHFESAQSSGMVMNKLKNLITEPVMPIRYMRQETMTVKNYTNVIIATNHPDPVRLAIHDRRFNVAPGQEEKLRITQAEHARIAEEVGGFAAFLMNYTVDEQRVRSVLTNAARENMIQAAQTSIEALFDAIRDSKLDFFLEFMQEQMPMQDSLVYGNYHKAVTTWVQAAVKNKVVFLTLDEIRAVYQYIIGTPIAPAKLRRMLSIHRVIYQSEFGGVATLWKVSSEQLAKAVKWKLTENPKLKAVTT